jgi:hypothetical protein
MAMATTATKADPPTDNKQPIGGVMIARSPRSQKRWRWVACGSSAALFVLAAVPESKAAELGYDVLAGVGATDNVRLTPADRRGDVIAATGFDLTFHEQRRTLDADVTGDIEYLNYLRHSYGAQVVGNFIGAAHVTLVPQVLRWTFSDNFGQGSVDPAAAVTPINRENINFFSTGPDLTLPLGSSNEVLVEGRYSNVNYQKSSLTSNRYSGGVGVRHELSPNSGVSLNVQDEAIRFKESLENPNYDQQEAYARYDGQGVRTRVSFDVGYDKLKLQTSTASGAFTRLELTRQLTPFQSAILTAGHDFSDAGNEFLLLQALGGATLATQPIGASSSPFKQNYVTLAWTYQGRRTSFGLGGGYFKLTYQESNSLNEQRSTAGARLTRRFTPRLDGGLYAIYIREQFNNLLGGDYKQLDATAEMTYHINTKFSVDLEYAHTRRDNGLGSMSYSDNRAWLKLKYGRALPPPRAFVVPSLPAFPREPRY